MKMKVLEGREVVEDRERGNGGGFSQDFLSVQGIIQGTPL